MVAINIERASFELDGTMRERRFDAPLTALTGETRSGKSTLLEALWWVLGVDGMRLMRAAASFSRIGFTARIGEKRWRIMRSTVNRAEDVTFTDMTLGIDEHHPVKRSESCRSAADAFQDLLGIPRLGAGKNRVTMDLLIPWLYARQRHLPNDYMRGLTFSGQVSDCLFHAAIRNFSCSAWTSRGGR